MVEITDEFKEDDNINEYNMAFLIFQELHKVRMAKLKCEINKDLVGWASCLRAIYRIIFTITNASRDTKINNAIENEFKKVENIIDKNYDNIKDPSINRTLRARNDKDAYFMLNELDKRISLVMKNVMTSATVRGLKKLNLGLGEEKDGGNK